MSKTNKSNENLSFESHLNKAKEIVNKLESGDCNLDQMLTLYKDGIVSLNHCNKKLSEFENEIKIIKKDINNIDLSDE
tara:strand:+ start:1465 stop:1698 length:234 start_codon:yes stop_codon:yes gene_type:complete